MAALQSLWFWLHLSFILLSSKCSFHLIGYKVAFPSPIVTWDYISTSKKERGEAPLLLRVQPDQKAHKILAQFRLIRSQLHLHGWLTGSLYSRPTQAYSKIKDSTTIKWKQWKLEENWQLLPYNVQKAFSCLGKLACSFVTENNLFSVDKDNKITLVKKLNASVMECPLTKFSLPRKASPHSLLFL